MDLKDRETLRLINEGYIDRYSDIIKRYSSRIRRYIYQYVKEKEDIDDIMQEIFLKHYKSLGRLDITKPLYPYLLQIAKNEVKIFLRKRKKHISLKENMFLEDESFVENISSLFSFLSSVEKIIVDLLYRGYSYSEIGEKLKKPTNTIKTMIRRIRLQFNNKKR